MRRHRYLPLLGLGFAGDPRVDALLQSRGSAGSDPNAEARCSALERSEKYPQSAISSHLSSGHRPLAVSLGGQALPGCRDWSCSTQLPGSPMWRRLDSRPSGLERRAPLA